MIVVAVDHLLDLVVAAGAALMPVHYVVAGPVAGAGDVIGDCRETLTLGSPMTYPHWRHAGE